MPKECVECGRHFQMGGPLWSDPIHDTAFVAKLLGNIKGAAAKYATHTRMLGMVTVIAEVPSLFFNLFFSDNGC